MRIQPSSLFPICRSWKQQRYGMLLLLCLLCAPTAADTYTPTLPASSFRSTTTIGEKLAGSTSAGSSTFRILTTSETEQSSLISAFQSTSVMLSSASASGGGSSAVGASRSSGSSLGVSIPSLPASGIVPSPAQMANILASSTYGNIPNPPDDIDPTNPENGAPVGDALLPLLLLALLYTIRLRKKPQSKGLFSWNR